MTDSTSEVDYTDSFEWSDGLVDKMRSVFGINSFRLCQESVCNASMDTRDVICVMPTGGGKSLTYQLPALLEKGCTVVISPLISLIEDQLLHLRHVGINAVALNSEMESSDQQFIKRQLEHMASFRTTDPHEVKLLYVTPERLTQDGLLRAVLQRLRNAGKFARFVVDEAHCISQYGHDFRPAYTELSILRGDFPDVPIIALSATCSKRVLDDLLSVLKLKPTAPGSRAPPDRTVYFSAPLYRKNLHYSVLPRPPTGARFIALMKSFILERYPDQSGIIYCLSRKDTIDVANKLSQESGGEIKAAPYHAKLSREEKASVHERWRGGEVKIICATIAFGLGIDKPDVRFVLHHTAPKSLEGLYQETGRAGRDGKDAECILFYRPQDSSTLMALERRNFDHLYHVFRYAQDIRECRKVQFARYFKTSFDLEMESWRTDEAGAEDPCGHCDNCLRSPTSILSQNVQVALWKILKVLSMVVQQKRGVTIQQLADFARSGASSRGRSKGRALVLDLDVICGGRVEYSAYDAELLCVNLLYDGYLRPRTESISFAPGQSRAVVYFDPSRKAEPFLHQSLEQLKSDPLPEMPYCFNLDARKTFKKGFWKQTPGNDADVVRGGGKKRARVGELESEDDDSDGVWEVGSEADSESDKALRTPAKRARRYIESQADGSDSMRNKYGCSGMPTPPPSERTLRTRGQSLRLPRILEGPGDTPENPLCL